MKLIKVLFILLVLLSASCNSFRHMRKSNSSQVVNLDTLTIRPKEKSAIYHESTAHENDILHTRLEIKFDWEKAYLYGQATLTLKPYFYPQAQLKLNAVGFDIKEIDLLKNGIKTKLEYNYDNKIITANLTKTYTRNDSFQVYIEYTAKPNSLQTEGSKAVTSDKGLYFINADGADIYKPKQIYTQSETQSSSCWFPTIDAPNQRMTQEIFLTVDKKYTTLSNGLLLMQIENTDGTRTDYWKQTIGAPPYLSMIAVGEFAVVKDKWRNKEVSYYVEKNYGKYAENTFGKTPEMIEFFSKKLGVDFPWEKYAQVVVRDYPGGSMENASATLHGSFMNITERELIDDTKDEYITHELFHQWFGNMVTCESWSNTALNESFATYGEYLWLEHAYGKEEADIHHQDDLDIYFNEARAKQVNMIRYDYDDADDMFDRHSYEKGGRILHMLRNYVGDDAFFTALNLYLTQHKFSSVEIHDLRLAFEKVTGQDLNWFFNQWFFASGHPDLFITTEYNDATKKETVHIEQLQDITKTPIFKLPIAIDIYSFGKKVRHQVTINKQKEDFIFDVSAKPNLVNVDADKMLVCKKNDVKTQDEWAFQYNNCPLYLDRFEAINELSKNSTSKSKEIIIKALNDKNWSIRNFALSKIDLIAKSNSSELQPMLIKLAEKDEKSSVRTEAIETLGENFDDEDLLDVYKKGLKDKSYDVEAAALSTLYKKNPIEGFEAAKAFANDSNLTLLHAILTILSASGSDEENDFFLKNNRYFQGFSNYSFTQIYGKYLLGRSDTVINSGLPILEQTARTARLWWIRLAAWQAIDSLQSMYAEREKELNSKKSNPSNSKSEANNSSDLDGAIERSKSQHEKIKALLTSIKNTETDKNLLRHFSN